MTKEFDIEDILNAVTSISKIEKKKTKINEKKNSSNKNTALIHNNRVKFDESEILVLNEMIE
jgi:hypothetical protein